MHECQGDCYVIFSYDKVRSERSPCRESHYRPTQPLGTRLHTRHYTMSGRTSTDHCTPRTYVARLGAADDPASRPRYPCVGRLRHMAGSRVWFCTMQGAARGQSPPISPTIATRRLRSRPTEHPLVPSTPSPNTVTFAKMPCVLLGRLTGRRRAPEPAYARP